MADSGHIVTADGRRPDLWVSGPAGGLPLVFHHGTPGAGTPVRALEHAAHRRGLRVVSASRPGYGWSARRPGRCVADVVADTEAVLAALGAGRCLAAGWSGGGPHALACAARLGAAAAVLVIAGVAPFGAVLTGGFADDLAAGSREAVRAGIEGWLDDDLAFTRPWGFELAETSVPMMIWQGSEDLMVPFAHGRWLDDQFQGISDRRRSVTA